VIRDYSPSKPMTWKLWSLLSISQHLSRTWILNFQYMKFIVCWYQKQS